MEISNYFDEIILFDTAKFEPPKIIGLDLFIITEDAILTTEHPFNNTNKEMLLEKSRLKFKGVTKSIRKIHEYLGNPKFDGFAKPYEIIDISTVIGNCSSKTYEFDGILKKPFSHVDWQIECKSFSLITSDNPA